MQVRPVDARGHGRPGDVPTVPFEKREDVALLEVREQPAPRLDALDVSIPFSEALR